MSKPKKPAPPTVKRIRKENADDTDPGQVVKTKKDLEAEKAKGKCLRKVCYFK